MEAVHLRRSKRILQGHLWVFSNEIREPLKQYRPGSLVEVYDIRDQFLGIGYINPNSLIAVRILTREREDIDRGFFRRRIEAAHGLRRRILPGREAFRLVFSEADLLPGLIVDKYGGCLVLQFLTFGIEMFREVVLEVLDEMFSPDLIVVRNDSSVRTLEGLSLQREVVKGTVPPYPVIREDGLLFEVDPLEGQKTGFFLDQRENRILAKEFIRGGRGLDLFCYMGAWSLHLAAAGADVVCVDSSERALQRAERNAGLNGLTQKLTLVREDVFAFLQRMQDGGESLYDFIILDPPAFVKSQGKLKEAMKAYQQVNESAMKLLKKGGILVTSSCSYHLGRELFLDMLRQAGRGSGRSLRLLALRSQAPDHPIHLLMPENEYLKCAFLMVD